MLAEYLSRLATEYTYERVKKFSGSGFGDFVRHDISIEANGHTLKRKAGGLSLGQTQLDVMQAESGCSPAKATLMTAWVRQVRRHDGDHCCGR